MTRRTRKRRRVFIFLVRPDLSAELLVLDPMRDDGVRTEPPHLVLLVFLEVASNHSTWLSPSKARICVAMRSRNQRSWLMMTAQLAKSSSASSSARSVSTSRSLLGSSSSSTLAPVLSILARCTRLRSPPDNEPIFFCWSPPLKLNAETYPRE